MAKEEERARLADDGCPHAGEATPAEEKPKPRRRREPVEPVEILEARAEAFRIQAENCAEIIVDLTNDIANYRESQQAHLRLADECTRAADLLRAHKKTEQPA